MKLIWGENKQLQFKNDKEYFESLGVFSNPELTRIYIEDNAKRGSFSDAYRLSLYKNTRDCENLPNSIKNAMKDHGRINCNAYVENLIKNHGFVISGNIIAVLLDDVLKTLPLNRDECMLAFMKGYNLRCNNTESPLTKVSYVTDSINVMKAYLLQSDIPKYKSVKNRKKEKTFGKRDYIKAAIDNFEIGEAGEKIVYEFEKIKLLNAYKDGRIDGLKGKLEWVSRKDDILGYDIKSYDIEKKEEMLIEVKSTVLDEQTPFYMSENEMRKSIDFSNKYYVYRLYNMDRIKPEKVDFYILYGDISENKNLTIEKGEYMVRLANNEKII